MSFKLQIKTILQFGAFLVCIFYLGCTNIEKQDCKKTHWPTQGFEDGKEGRPSRVSMFLAKCSTYDITVETTAYLEGYEKGLDNFCSSDSAFSRGFQALSPEAVCSTKTNYKKNYDSGVQALCTESLGKTEAGEGKPINLFCSKISSYAEGYSSGLKFYCSDENASRLGAQGLSIPETCQSSASSQDYVLNYKKGRKSFLLKDVEKLKNKLKKIDQSLKEVNESYTEKLAYAYDLPNQAKGEDLMQKRVKVDEEIKAIKEKKSKLDQESFEVQKVINTTNAEINSLD